ITFTSCSAYIVTNFLPIVYSSCPYKTPLSQYMFPLYAYIRRRIPGFPTSHTLREAESTTVRNSADEMDVQALVWLINMSSNPSVESIVIESTSALPLKSVDTFKRSIDNTNVFLACSQALERLARDPDVSVHESKVDRLIRATLRFTSFPYIIHLPQPAKDSFSSTLYADLLCIHLNCVEEVRELVMSNLIASDDDHTALRLQPIIWAHLLRRVLFNYPSPDQLAVMQMLFVEIPSLYWKADYVPTTYALESFGMNIPSESDDSEMTLRMAIQRSLYIYVAENILHDYMLLQPTIFRQNDGDEKYPRLCLLLSMAGSRSMRSIRASSFAFNQSLFITIVQSIGDLVDIASPYKDNDNRHTVLEFLYTLITLVEFDDPLNPREQTTALMMFFRVLNSTSSRPAFLETDWCTPQLATKFVRLSVWYHMRDAGERCSTYFFQYTSFTNETLASFVSNLFEELRTDINNGALQTFLRLIITRLGSEDSSVHIRQQSLEYLHEPGNLFTSCIALIRWDDTRTLRHLALLYPEHDSWPVCLQRLEDSEIEQSGVADFKAFIQLGRVGAFGEVYEAPCNPAIVLSQGENDKSLQHLWSTVRHRVQWFIAGKPSREGTEPSSNDNRV
ncbi:hypothetical protein EDD85DRAFT_854491, partial [Armillaria nabsnona]